MPVIKQYDSPITGLRPTETGVEATAAAARRSGAFFNQAASGREEVARATQRLGSEVASAGADAGRMFGSALKDVGKVAVDYMDHREISHGAVGYAGLNDALTQKWNDTAKNADPNDPTVAAKFREEVLEPELEKFRDGFNTERSQQWAETRIERLREHMYSKTAADMSTLAGQAVAVNVQQTSNALSNTAMRDPSSVPHLLETIDHSVGEIVDSSPNLKGADAGRAKSALTEKMKEGIVKAGAIGAIQNGGDPDAIAAAWGAKYPQYINGAELKQLSAAATRENSYRRTDENVARVNQDRIRKEASEGRRGQYIEDLYSGDPQKVSAITARAISRDPLLTVQDREHLIGVLNRELKPETSAKVSNASYVDLLGKIRAGEITDVGAIYDARTADKINRADFNQLLKDFTDFRSPEGERVGKAEEQFITAVKPLIDKSNPLMGKIDQDGPLNLYRMRMDIKAKVEEYRKANKDWRDLFDPSKPDFMGRPEALTPYQKPLQQSISDSARRLGGGGTTTPATPREAPPARKTNETPAQYLKRTGAQ